MHYGHMLITVKRLGNSSEYVDRGLPPPGLEPRLLHGQLLLVVEVVEEELGRSLPAVPIPCRAGFARLRDLNQPFRGAWAVFG